MGLLQQSANTSRRVPALPTGHDEESCICIVRVRSYGQVVFVQHALAETYGNLQTCVLVAVAERRVLRDLLAFVSVLAHLLCPVLFTTRWALEAERTHVCACLQGEIQQFQYVAVDRLDTERLWCTTCEIPAYVKPGDVTHFVILDDRSFDIAQEVVRDTHKRQGADVPVVDLEHLLVRCLCLFQVATDEAGVCQSSLYAQNG